MRVLYTGPRAVPDAGAEFVALPELLARADFVSIHAPLHASTHHLIGACELAAMQPGAFLINTARGPIVDEQALLAALRERRIAGAALDVFEREPQLTAGLTELDNVVLAPHLGSATVETRTRMCTMAAANVVACLRGERPKNLVDDNAWERRRQ
jgi:glyoxylate reductase